MVRGGRTTGKISMSSTTRSRKRRNTAGPGPARGGEGGEKVKENPLLAVFLSAKKKKRTHEN